MREWLYREGLPHGSACVSWHTAAERFRGACRLVREATGRSALTISPLLQKNDLAAVSTSQSSPTLFLLHSSLTHCDSYT